MAIQKQCRDNLQGLLVDMIVFIWAEQAISERSGLDSGSVKHEIENGFFAVLNCLDSILPNMVSDSQLLFVEAVSAQCKYLHNPNRAAVAVLSKRLALELSDKAIVVKRITLGISNASEVERKILGFSLLVSPEDAAQRVMQLMTGNQTEVAYPFLFSVVNELTNLLSGTLNRRIEKRFN
jgi:hypothetical protein